MEKKIQQMNNMLSNIAAGYGVFGSLDELKKELPTKDNDDLLQELDYASSLLMYLSKEDRFEYYQDISLDGDDAKKRIEQDDEYFHLLEEEAKKRNLV
jgi:hypothetical protein